MSDLEERIAKLEELTESLAELAQVQATQIDGLKEYVRQSSEISNKIPIDNYVFMRIDHQEKIGLEHEARLDDYGEFIESFKSMFNAQLEVNEDNRDILESIRTMILRLHQQIYGKSDATE